MSVGTKLLQAAAGNAGEAVYVDDVFSCFLHVGNSSSGRSINNGIDLDGEGGLVWIKGRDSAYNNVLYDTARGATQEMYSNNTDRSAANTNALTAFNSNGFTIGTAGEVNNNSNDYVSWTFRKQEKFFDIVTWTGDGNSSKTISHNLGSTPGMMILKRTNGLPTAGNWIVFHRSIANDRYLVLNSTVTDASYGYDWSPTDTTFTAYLLGGADYSGNTNGDTYIAYLFAHNEQDFGEDSDEAIINCGTYTGTGASGTAPVINLGFEPQWMLIKNADDGGGNWMVMDTMRGWGADGSDIGPKNLRANTAEAETNWGSYNYDLWTVNPTGFTAGPTDLYNVNNTTGAKYVYVAIARPHKPASELAATDLFAVDNRTTTTSPAFISGFPVDMAIHRTVDETGSRQIASRLTGSKVLFTDSSSTESTISSVTFDYMNGHREGASANADEYAWMFRRAKGFFDVVTYTGSSSVQNVAHNLGAVPEMMWIKRRDTFTANWAVYHSAMGNDKALNLNTDKSYLIATDSQFNSTTPTASVFTVGANYSTTNNNGRSYIAYLFASVSGISKVGSYTGTGNDLNVDCGFSAGARFVLIKRWDRVGGSFGSNGDWYVYDSVRGIVAGNDPYLLLNTTDTQVTNTDYIDPLSSGFTVTSSAPDALNASGGTYIFLATA
tara:strand:- start:1454 stop:3448 length:1995 start_codon:yes stop_codon:yes gene_type:complete